MTWRAFIYRVGYPFAKAYWWVFHPKTVGAACVIMCGGDILLIRNTYGGRLWSFPGGGVNEGEDPRDAAIREVKEEVGVDLTDVVFLGKLLYDYGRHDDTVHVFRSAISAKSFRIDPNEIAEARWFSVYDVPVGKLSRVGKGIFGLFMKNEQSLLVEKGT